MSDFLKRFADDLEKNVPGFIAFTVVEVKSGNSYFSFSVGPEYDPELASTFYLEIVRAKLNFIAALDLKDQKMDTIVVTLISQIHFLDLSDNGEYFIYLALQDGENVNLAISKLLINKYKQELKLIQEEKKLIEEELKRVYEDLTQKEDEKSRLIRQEREIIEAELRLVQEDLKNSEE